MSPFEPPPPLEYARPARRVRRTWVHRKTAIVVFVVDLVLMGTGFGLAVADIQSWLIAGPVLLLNLPALPIACVFSGMFEGRDEPSQWIGVVRVVAMFLCEATIASLGWGWVANHYLGRGGGEDAPSDDGR